MSEIQGDILPIELPAKRIQLVYLTNWGIVLAVLPWTLFFLLLFFGPFLIGGYHPMKHLWNDWVVSRNYETIPNTYADYSCWDNGGRPRYTTCGVTYYANISSLKQKLNIRFENYPYSWFNVLTPDDLVLEGQSSMIRSVYNPSRTTFLFGVETIKIRFLTYFAWQLLLFLVLVAWFFGLFFYWRIYYWRSVANDVCLKAVKIVDVKQNRRKEILYHYYGLSPSILAMNMRVLPYSSGIIINPAAFNTSFTFFKKDKQPFYLDEEKTIAVAIEAKQAGGAIYLIMI
ncbi:hypothetical protein [Bartonella sp. HY038]|uniref:hypothetical protein n=1 Tax=Bartonella sp. HY038 TaxID=2759660 RepID=UPI0015FA08AD|nr:hypothetical protein [Bartonella sp. HY038]